MTGHGYRAFLEEMLAPLGGVLADKLDRRRFLIATTVAEAVWLEHNGVDAVIAMGAERGRGKMMLLWGAALGLGVMAFAASSSFWITLPIMICLATPYTADLFSTKDKDRHPLTGVRRGHERPTHQMIRSL